MRTTHLCVVKPELYEGSIEGLSAPLLRALKGSLKGIDKVSIRVGLGLLGGPGDLVSRL